VLSEYGLGREIILTASQGSIIAVDILRLHKGSVVNGSGRLHLQCSTPLFGANYPKVKFSQEKTSTLQKMIQSSPSICKAYI
jgi:hypothetical protein